MAEAPIIADIKPIKVELEVGKKYFWCKCGLSVPMQIQQQIAVCDGTHSKLGDLAAGDALPE